MESIDKSRANGTVTELASWSAEFDDTYEMAVQSIAVDLVTGVVGLFGYYGGFATYNEGDGLIFHRQADLEELMAYLPILEPLKTVGVFILSFMRKVKFPFVDLIFKATNGSKK